MLTAEQRRKMLNQFQNTVWTIEGLCDADKTRGSIGTYSRKHWTLEDLSILAIENEIISHRLWVTPCYK